MTGTNCSLHSGCGGRAISIWGQLLSGLAVFEQISPFARDGRLQLGPSSLVTQAGLAAHISVLQPCWGPRCLPRQKQLLESAKAMAGVRQHSSETNESALQPWVLKIHFGLGNFSCTFFNAALWLRDACAGGNWVDLKPSARLFEMLRKEFFPNFSLKQSKLSLGQILSCCSDRHPVTSAEGGL